MDVRASKETETAQAKKADKFVISFVVQNNINDYNSAEVYVVVKQPDDQVLQNPVWESGSMASRNGQKEYTRKVKFEYNKGEAKKLLFSLDPDSYQKGNYTVQLYHNGSMIGQTIKTLY